jgi:hypothetical protein
MAASPEIFSPSASSTDSRPETLSRAPRWPGGHGAARPRERPASPNRLLARPPARILALRSGLVVARFRPLACRPATDNARVDEGCDPFGVIAQDSGQYLDGMLP